MSDTLPPWLRAKGRGAGSNASGRFEPETREVVHDGWDIQEEERVLRTELRLERPRSALTRNASPDIPFDRSLNPYRGCEHGCIYCFARPSHAYLNLSPGLDFETRLIARPGMAEVLARELRNPRYIPAPVAIGTNTDPYQPIERDQRVMRALVQVLHDFRHPLAIVTKGALIERDLDLLAPMAGEGLLHVGISVTTLDADLSRRMEPRAPAPARRLQMIERLARAGVPVRVMVAPVVPALTDHETEAILQAAADAGASAASWIMLRLPREVAPLFREWLEREFPDRAARVMGRVRDLHGGRDYDAQWGKRMTGQGAWADLARQRFAAVRRRAGLAGKLPALRCDLFAPPPRPGDQLSLAL